VHERDAAAAGSSGRPATGRPPAAASRRRSRPLVCERQKETSNESAVSSTAGLKALLRPLWWRPRREERTSRG
jgi:hypothetical protein